ncbi:alpha-ketoglutarate-dependent dioxygenase AlkB [Tropicimonas sp. TH_r6]|uniref:alpha-ketoglutarate-dependent dioxygenase AlkB n=1 Tax=Tropicimonas sp. TH_r6 TaxID=3082085 RepID=UPI0029544336|nr:alpha-ketoglutarate-dependent dioxygenase AlkB [Tropicimonas sp. TH_r6]MDV7144111.1 alpha-ketoglutarate-dependent dioxygenase AlkB [Tropicimonas sp. TH_r6]
MVKKSKPTPTMTIRGVRLFQGLLSREVQTEMLGQLREIARAAPFFRPVTSRGQNMSVRMTSAGTVGWISDRRGYRYETQHPDGKDWPPIPESILSVWTSVAPDAPLPDSCLINFYDPDARMGMHQDRDETDLDQPVVSISLGDEALFRIGNLTRGGKTESVWLNSGDVLVMGGPARLVYHGIDRIRPGSSQLLPDGGRINLTLRVAR